MHQSSQVTVEHVVRPSTRPYEQVKAALETRMSMLTDIDEFVRQMAAANVSWEQIRCAIEERLGSSGFSIFFKIEQGELLTLAGKPSRVTQYAAGNPLLAIRMIEHEPDVALYAPLRLALYEGKDGGSHIIYDRFPSVVAPYKHSEVAAVAPIVQQQFDELITSVLGENPTATTV